MKAAYIAILILLIALTFGALSTQVEAPIVNKIPFSTPDKEPISTPEEPVSEEPVPQDIPEVSPVEEPAEQTEVSEEDDVPSEAAQTSDEEILLREVNSAARKALVNITCELRVDNTIRKTSGSGILIDERGVILTNSHVVYLYLLDEALGADAVSCIVRTGSPATPKYLAEPLYISESWIRENSEKLALKETGGTGENDYAFLYVTETVGGEDPPASYPSLPISLTRGVLNAEDKVLTIAYPAEFLFQQSVLEELYLTSDVGTVSRLYTFEGGAPDLVTVQGSILAQRGASGGAVVDIHGELAGLIVTSSKDTLLTDRSVGALTLSYISRDLDEQTGETLRTFLTSISPADRLRHFEQEIAPDLRAILDDAFDENDL